MDSRRNGRKHPHEALEVIQARCVPQVRLVEAERPLHARNYGMLGDVRLGGDSAMVLLAVKSEVDVVNGLAPPNP